MAKVYQIQHFSSIAAFKEHWGITLPRPHDWRLLVKPEVGAIHGIPSSQGVAVATNGILVAIQRWKDVFIGHIDSFVPDNEYTTASKMAKPTRVVKHREAKVDISEFV